MRKISHHWHVLLDDVGKPTPAAVEHEHLVNVGRRHAHYRDYDSLVRDLKAAEMPLPQARAMALRLDRTAYTTLDLAREPRLEVEEAGIAATLHPEVRRSLT